MAADPKDRVCIAYAHGEAVSPPFAFSAWRFGLLGYGQRCRGLLTMHGPYIENNRNRVVRQFLTAPDSEACQWLWFLDVDIGFPPDTLEKLLAEAAPDRLIIGAAYYAMHGDHSRVTWLDETLTQYRRMPAGRPAKVTAVGMGCTIIHKRVFEDIERMYADGKDQWVWFARDLGEKGRMGEDVSFCLRAREAGHASWGATDVIVEHFKSRPVEQPDGARESLALLHETPSGLLIPAD